MNIAISGKPILRKDLNWSLFECNSPFRWVASDPLGGEHHFFSAIEKEFLELFDGTRTVQDVVGLIEKEKPGTLWTFNRASAFAKLMAVSRILLTDDLGVGQNLAIRQSRQRLLGNWGWLLQPLSIRIPLLQPVFAVRMLSPLGSILFSKVVALFVLLLFSCMVFNVMVLWEDIFNKLPDPSAVMRGDRLWMAFIALIVVKSCHEMGHALACYRFTGKVGEMGLMLLAFAPCLYCDVSASWTTTSKWKRIAVALAGMYVEILLASLAVVLFFVQSDENFRVFMLYIFGICSVGTLFLNANPLVKYDGYYALSDWLGVPNLSEQANQAISSLCQNFLSRNEAPQYSLDGSKWLLALYWILSAAYRLVLVAAIIWAMNLMLRPLGLDFIVHYILFLVAMTYAIALMKTLRQIRGYFESFLDIKWFHGMLCLGLIVLVSYFFFAFPFSDACIARGLIKFKAMVPVYCQQEGRLSESRGGDREVKQGELIARFDNPLLQEKLIELNSLRERLGTQFQLRNELAVWNTEKDYQLPTLQKNLEVIDKQLIGLRKEIDQLTVLAPRDGFLLHPAQSYAREQEGVELGTWKEFPLQQHNAGVWLDKGMLLGWVVDRKQPLVEVYVEEGDLRKLTRDCSVEISLDGKSDQRLRGTLKTIATESTTIIPQEFAGDWSLIGIPDPSGRLITDRPKFRVVVELESQKIPLHLGSLATVRIQTNSQTLYQRCREYLSRYLWDASRIERSH